MRVCLDPGHGGNDPGAIFNHYEEKNVALRVGRRLNDLIIANGDVCLMTRSWDFFVPIGTRCQVANDWKAEVFVSLHMNADPDPDLAGMYEAHGGEIWIYPNSVNGRRLANAIGLELLATFPDEPFRGIKEGDLGVLRGTRMPACLVEMGFIDHSETARRMEDVAVQQWMAEAIHRGIMRYKYDD